MTQFNPGDRVKVVGWSTYWDGPATVVNHNGPYVRVRPDGDMPVGAFEPNFIERIEEPTPDDDIDAFIEEWGARLEKMYVNRTAGDNSFTGFVVALMQDMKSKGVQPR